MTVWRNFQAPFCSNFLFLESFGCLVSIGSNFVRFRATMVSTPPNYSNTHHGNARAPLSLYVSVWENMDDGGVSYLGCMTGIWVDFMEITKGISKVAINHWIFLVFFSLIFLPKNSFYKKGGWAFLGKYKKWEAMWWCFGTTSYFVFFPVSSSIFIQLFGGPSKLHFVQTFYPWKALDV